MPTVIHYLITTKQQNRNDQKLVLSKNVSFPNYFENF